MATNFVVRLTDEERQLWTDFVSKGKTAAYIIKVTAHGVYAFAS